MEHRLSLAAIGPELQGEVRQILDGLQNRVEGRRGHPDHRGSYASDAWDGVRLEVEEDGHPGRHRRRPFAGEGVRRWVDCAVELLAPSAEPCRWGGARSGA